MTKLLEVFRPIPLFPPYYISNIGRVKYSRIGKVKFRKIQNQYDGHGRKKRQQITVKKGNRVYTLVIHKLVVAAFGDEKPTNSHTIDHIDRDPFNNNIVNLRWATPKQQRQNQNQKKRNRIQKKYKKITMEQLDKIYERTFSETLKSIGKDYSLTESQLWVLLVRVHPKY